MKLIEAVRIAAAAFRTADAKDDAELAACLISVGLRAASVDRLVSFVRMALGHELLVRMGVAPPTHYGLPDGTRFRLTDDPIFVAATAYARHEATRDDFEKMVLQSAELNAVNQALHAGSKAEDLQLGHTLFVTAPPALDDVTTELSSTLDLDGFAPELCGAHGVIGLAFECDIFPGVVRSGHVQLQLDIRARTPHGTICESFGAYGASLGAAVQQALDRFVRGSAHVLFATFVDSKLGADQVEWEDWGPFRACMGALITQYSEPFDTSFYAGFLDALQELTRGLPARPHWIRTYSARMGDRVFGCEVLLDNEPWPAAQSLLESANWPQQEQFYSVRHFKVLLPRVG